MDITTDPFSKSVLRDTIQIIKDCEKTAEFEEVARVVMKHLGTHPEKYHPHMRCIIDATNAELLEGVSSSGQTMDYIQD